MIHDERRRPDKDVIAGRVRFDRADSVPEGPLPYHYHDLYEIFCSLNPELRYEVNGRIYELGYGDVLVLNQFDIHQSLATPGEAYHRLITLFYPELLRGWSGGDYDLLARFENRRPGFIHLVRLRERDRERFREVFARGERLAAGGIQAPDEFLEARLALAEMLVIVNRGIEVSGRTDAQPELSPREERRLLAVLSYVDAKLQSDLSLGTLASRFATTPSGLNRLFRKARRLSVHQYVLQRRIQEARIHLSRGSTVREAAEASGFGNQSHFVRIFRSKTGRSPKEFQRLILQSRAGER